MKTSYYSKSSKDPNAVSIAGKTPHWYTGREYKKLAPKYWFFKRYKEDGDEEAFTEAYKEEILDKLDPKEIFEELGEDAILLCWESSEKFCHRHLVSKWFEEELNMNVGEIL